MQDANIIKLYRRIRVLLFRGLKGPEAGGTVKDGSHGIEKAMQKTPKGNYENIEVSHAR